MQIIQESYITLEPGDYEEHFKLSIFKIVSWIRLRYNSVCRLYVYILHAETMHIK